MVCSRNVVIKPDIAFAEAVKKDYDAVICPGGLKGAEHLASVSRFCSVLLTVVIYAACVLKIHCGLWHCGLWHCGCDCNSSVIRNSVDKTESSFRLIATCQARRLHS